MKNTTITMDSGVLSESKYTSATVLSTAANFIMNKQEPFTHTFRTYIRLRENGPLQLKFWHSNGVDSTWDQGQEATGSEPGGDWVIEAAYVADGGKEPDGSIVANTQQMLTFEGRNPRLLRLANASGVMRQASIYLKVIIWHLHGQLRHSLQGNHSLST